MRGPYNFITKQSLMCLDSIISNLISDLCVVLNKAQAKIQTIISSSTFFLVN